ncbi:hypothetical protein EVAR_96312_1 [Eumeta japonica]|uniref:Uncharacterized protein n=1 Tax=Eumeta variegata TaxID=151549 RepID=A0A4C1VXI0_EUMVA|nr:hypothetical protein EVAR_96312_1 [Eumeta japonica]
MRASERHASLPLGHDEDTMGADNGKYCERDGGKGNVESTVVSERKRTYKGKGLELGLRSGLVIRFRIRWPQRAPDARCNSPMKKLSKLNSDHLSHSPSSFIFVWKYFSNVFAHL